MSNNSSNTANIYEVSFSAPYGGGSIACRALDDPVSDNWTDEFAESLATALNGLTWPSGCGWSISRVNDVQGQAVLSPGDLTFS